MKITIESTTQIVEANGVKCRVWEGVTERGVKVPRDRRGKILGGIGISKWVSFSSLQGASCEARRHPSLLPACTTGKSSSLI